MFIIFVLHKLFVFYCEHSCPVVSNVALEPVHSTREKERAREIEEDKEGKEKEEKGGKY